MGVRRWFVWLSVSAAGALAASCSIEQSVVCEPVNPPPRAMIAGPPPGELAVARPVQAGDSPEAQRIAIRGFAFASSYVPMAGSIVTPCGRITFSTTNTEVMRGFAFRNIPSAGDAEIHVTFDQPLTELSLSVGWVQRGEYLAKFNIAPTSLSGTLVREGAKITTSRPYPADDGRGRVSWVSPSPDGLSFVLGGPPGTAIGIDGFEVACAPKPSSGTAADSSQGLPP